MVVFPPPLGALRIAKPAQTQKTRDRPMDVQRRREGRRVGVIARQMLPEK